MPTAEIFTQSAMQLSSDGWMINYNQNPFGLQKYGIWFTNITRGNTYSAITLKAAITTAADNISKWFFFYFS